MLKLHVSSIDRSLPIPLGTQLHGLLTYVLTSNEMPPGTKLRSIRQLAAELGVAAVTVSQVYQQLRDEGLVEVRAGVGAFTVKDPNLAPDENHPVHALSSDIAAIITRAEAVGVSSVSLAAMINARARIRQQEGGLKVVFVCIFEVAERDYVDQMRLMVSALDTIDLVTLESLLSDGPQRRACENADLVVTFSDREAEVRCLLDDVDVLGLRFLPSQRTRQALAGLDPRFRVAVVTQFQEYTATIGSIVRQFAPHISDLRVTWSSAPDLTQIMHTCDAVVLASGADHVAQLVRPDVQCIEYVHTPDPVSLQTALSRRLTALHNLKAAKRRSELLAGLERTAQE